MSYCLFTITEFFYQVFYRWLLLDNLYSLKAWVTCTSHMHEDTSLKTRQIKVKKTRYKIINQSTHFINELIYLNFVTVISLVHQLKKLVNYYLIIWRNSTSSSDSNTLSSRTQTLAEILP